MSFSKVKEYLDGFGKFSIMEFDKSTATVDLAANALGTIPDSICKTMAFYNNDGTAIIIGTSGYSKVSNSKFKNEFGFKPKMLKSEDVTTLTGHQLGGVCPFDYLGNSHVYLDMSLKKHEIVYPACGSHNSAIKMTISELEDTSKYIKWVDVTKEFEDEIR